MGAYSHKLASCGMMRRFALPVGGPMTRKLRISQLAASSRIGIGLFLLGFAVGGQQACAQGQDSTPGERNLRIMAELLPGYYDNSNQSYFDVRRKLPAADRHPRMSTTITRVDAPAFGRHVYLWVNRSETAAGPVSSYRLATLDAGPAADEVTMRHYLRMQGEITTAELQSLQPKDLHRTEGCDYFFKRRADHFRGLQGSKACRFEWEGQQVYTDNEISLSRSSLWFHDHKWIVKSRQRISGVASGEPFWLERARYFHCYADVPGVGGGVDIPFTRYDDMLLHDRGDTHWFTAKTDPARNVPQRELALNLRAVTWQVLNEANDYFNRNSLVLSVLERLPDGSAKEHGYAFTDPDAERIAMNMKWILVNCAVTARKDAKPEM
ncbi:MAG: hypothetical protein FJ160_11020 [Gammaproteobacteria bacterium]|nr:hypothetical protein [Gammaproteobacteria bacterium]